MGVEIIGLPIREPEESSVKDCCYWYDGNDAIQLFFDCSDQWREGFGGISAFDMNVVLGLIPFYCTKKPEQLQLYRDVRAFAAGVLQHIVEQRDKNKDT